MAATSEFKTFFNSSIQTSPFSFDLISTISKPAIAALAGFVPWAESGMITFFLISPFFSKYFLIIIMPVNSPCAPAIGCRVTASIPVIIFKVSCNLYINSSEPWLSSSL